MGWRNVHTGIEGENFELGGVQVWRHNWRRTDEDTLRLPHPSYPNQVHRFDIYEIGSIDHPVRFAAAELSNGVWGFYVRQ
jgi:hypothetical protein